MQLTQTTTANQINELMQRALSVAADPHSLLLPWGVAVGRIAARNARAKGGRVFWFEVADSVRVKSVGPDTVTVGAYHVAAAQKQFGGKISAKNARALTIPLTAEARGKRAFEFEAGGRKLFVLPSQNGENVGVLGYSENGEFHGLYLLRRSVSQQAEPFWASDAEVMQEGSNQAAQFLRRAIGGGAG